jgi:hypothetical protein
MVIVGDNLGFDGESRRGRCIGHTINLAAKALLFGNSSDAFEEQLNGSSAVNSAIYQLGAPKSLWANYTTWWWMCAMCTSYTIGFRRPKKKAKSRGHCG